MKKLLIFKLFIVLLIVPVGVGLSQSFESPHFKLEHINDGIYAAIHKPGGQAICNGGFVDLGEEVLVFDSFLSTAAARDLKQAIDEISGKPVHQLSAPLKSGIISCNMACKKLRKNNPMLREEWPFFR
jgi:hypothetical protein